jgi:hypothetical protein
VSAAAVRRRYAGCRSILLAAAIAATVPPFAAPARAQSANPLTLPPVSVTAPPPLPLYLRPGNGLKAFERNPYFGDNRVEEDRFAPVPCSGFRIEPAAASGASDRLCLQGQRLAPAYMYGSKGMGDESGSRDCEIDHDLAIFDIGDLSVEADVLVFDPYKLRADTLFPDADCYVAGYSGYDREDFADMNRVTRRGTDWHDWHGESCRWSDERPACETKSIEFSEGRHQCIAVRRPGPRWHGGFVWMLTASICHTDTAGVQPGDVARALGALEIRRYDPVGNLARPPQ